MSSRRPNVRKAVSRFANELRGVTQQLNDGVNFLSRAVQHKPCIGPREFRDVLSDLQDEVSGITTEVEVLEQFTVDAISFEELLGHCLALYQANRNTIQLLESHLHQYGYQPPPGVVQEPENPVAAAAVAAAAAREKSAGDGAESSGDEDDEDAERHGCRGGADSYVSNTHATTRGTMGHGPSTSSHAAPRHGASRHTSFASPSKSTAAGARLPGGRKGTPVNKHGLAHGFSASSDEEDGAGVDAMDCSDDDLMAPKSRQQQQRPGFGSTALGTQRPQPTGSMCGKGELFAAAQAASWSTAMAAAASIRASARKAARPSVDSHGSTTPDAMLLSPSMAQLLAKYNPPSDSDRGMLGLSASAAKPGAPATAGSTPDTEELEAAMHGFTPFSRQAAGAAAQEAAAAPEPQATVPQKANVASAVAAAPFTMVAQQALQGLRPPPVEDDTCLLYRELIRSQHVPSSLNQQRPRPQPQQPTQPQVLQDSNRGQDKLHNVLAQVPALKLGQSTATATAAPSAAAVFQPGPPQQQQQQQQARPHSAAAFGSPGIEECTPPPTSVGKKRSITPHSARSVPRNEWQQHDKLLAAKMAGLEQEWIASGQAALSPLRRSWGGGGSGGGAAPAPAAADAKAPAFSRMAAEAAAAAAAVVKPALAAAATAKDSLMGVSGAAGVAGGFLNRASQPHPQQRYGQAPAGMASPARQMDTVMEEADTARVLSPVGQQASPAVTPGGRGGRGSRLPAASTTVVGATVTPTKDVAKDGRGCATPKAQIRGTPGRVGRGGGGGMATPGRVPQQASSPVAGGRANGGGAATPGRLTRITSLAGAAAVAAAPVGAAGGKSSKMTPLRMSFAGAFPAMAAASAAAMATGGAASASEPSATAATPGRAGRIPTFAPTAAVGTTGNGVAGAAVSAAPSNRTPGRIRREEARSESSSAAGSQGGAAAVPQLRFQSFMRDGASGGGSSGGGNDVNGDWQGFPLSRRGTDSSGGGGGGNVARPTTSDEVTLAMPPITSQPPTPRALTPGRDGRPAAAEAAAAEAAAPVAALATSLAMLVPGLSPGTSQLVSKALGGDFNLGQFRPQPPASTTTSRIPTSTTAARPAVPYHTLGTSSGGGADYRAPPATAAGAAAVAAAAAAPLPGDLQLCSEEEWRGLPPRTQQCFPLDVLNKHLQTMAQAVAARPDAASGRCFSAEDLGFLGLATMPTKQLLNTLVKLGRCEVVTGGGGSMMYRLAC